MDEYISWELQYIALTITVGAIMALIYDIFRVLRRIVRHGNVVVAIEDIFYWMTVSLITFIVCFVEDGGNVRWFAIFGEVLGAYMYYQTIGRKFVEYVSLIIFFPVKIIKKALKKLNK